MKKTVLLIIFLFVSVLGSTAFAYGRTTTPNGYIVEDRNSFTRNGPFCYDACSADAWHSETGAYISHYSRATITTGGRYGTVVSQSAREWCSSNEKTSYAECQATNAATHVGYGWWGGIY